MCLERGKTLGKIAHGDVNVSLGPSEIVRETGDDNENIWMLRRE